MKRDSGNKTSHGIDCNFKAKCSLSDPVALGIINLASQVLDRRQPKQKTEVWVPFDDTSSSSGDSESSGPIPRCNVMNMDCAQCKREHCPPSRGNHELPFFQTKNYVDFEDSGKPSDPAEPAETEKCKKEETKKVENPGYSNIIYSKIMECLENELLMSLVKNLLLARFPKYHEFISYGIRHTTNICEIVQIGCKYTPSENSSFDEYLEQMGPNEKARILSMPKLYTDFVKAIYFHGLGDKTSSNANFISHIMKFAFDVLNLSMVKEKSEEGEKNDTSGTKSPPNLEKKDPTEHFGEEKNVKQPRGKTEIVDIPDFVDLNTIPGKNAEGSDARVKDLKVDTEQESSRTPPAEDLNHGHTLNDILSDSIKHISQMQHADGGSHKEMEELTFSMLEAFSRGGMLENVINELNQTTVTGTSPNLEGGRKESDPSAITDPVD